MTTQAPPQPSQHLAAARELLDELQTQGPGTDSQTKAVTATAEAVLVLAEQVAAIRVLLVGNAMSRRTDGHPAPADGQPPPQEEKTPKKRGWW